MRGARAGNAVEVRVARRLEDRGWIVGSRRHIGGAGDLLAVRAESPGAGSTGYVAVRLIEVKSTAGGPWERFGPAARAELVAAALRAGASAELWWWPPRAPEPRVYASPAFPS